MEIDTDLAYEHGHLIELFLDANKLNAQVVSYHQEISQIKYACIRIVINDIDSELAFTAMGIRNYGVKNMLDHFLMKCGISVHDLHPRHYKEKTFKSLTHPFIV